MWVLDRPHLKPNYPHFARCNASRLRFSHALLEMTSSVGVVGSVGIEVRNKRELKLQERREERLKRIVTLYTHNTHNTHTRGQRGVQATRGGQRGDRTGLQRSPRASRGDQVGTSRQPRRGLSGRETHGGYAAPPVRNRYAATTARALFPQRGAAPRLFFRSWSSVHRRPVSPCTGARGCGSGAMNPIHPLSGVLEFAAAEWHQGRRELRR